MRRVFLALITLVVMLSFAQAARAGNDLKIGAPAPPITLAALDGRHIDTQALRGKVVILTFWATWCGPCREELPLLSRYARRHAKQGLVVLGFSLDTPDELPQVRKVADSLGF